MSVRIETLRPAELTDDDRERWCAVIANGDRYSPLFHPDFVGLVAQFRSDVRVIKATDAAGRLGFLPLHRRLFGFSRPISATLSDYHGPIREPGFELSPEAMLRGGKIQRYKYFARIGSGKGGSSRGLRADLVPGEASPFECFQLEHSKKAKQFRRLRRKLENEHGEIVLSLGNANRETFNQLRGWKQDQFQRTGRHNVLKPTWIAHLLNRLHDGGEGEVSGYLVSLSVNGRPVAAEFGPRWRGAFHPWIAAYDPEFTAYSPGHLLVADLLQRMQTDGLDRYDLGHDDAPYKAMFANNAVALSAGSWCADGRSELTHNMRGLPGKIVRRWEQICLAETHPVGLLAGAAYAATSLMRK